MTMMWGQNANPIEGEGDEEETSALNRRLREAKNYAWKRWRHGYVHSLVETYRITRKTVKVPYIGEIVLIVADEKNRRAWKNGKVAFSWFSLDKMRISFCWNKFESVCQGVSPYHSYGRVN